MLPFAQEITAEIEKEFQEVKAQLRVGYDENDSIRPHYYSITVRCRRRDMPEIEEHNTVEWSVGLKQFDGASYPTIYDHVAWLVDEEPDSWGLKIVARTFIPNHKVTPHTLNRLMPKLQTLYQILKREVEEHLQA